MENEQSWEKLIVKILIYRLKLDFLPSVFLYYTVLKLIFIFVFSMFNIKFCSVAFQI